VQGAIHLRRSIRDLAYDLRAVSKVKMGVKIGEATCESSAKDQFVWREKFFGRSGLRNR